MKTLDRWTDNELEDLLQRMDKAIAFAPDGNAKLTRNEAILVRDMLQNQVWRRRSQRRSIDG